VSSRRKGKRSGYVGGISKLRGNLGRGRGSFRREESFRGEKRRAPRYGRSLKWGGHQGESWKKIFLKT